MLNGIICIILILMDIAISAEAYYCDDNLCSNEQFCCGENICCNYVNNTIWHFICLLISLIVLAFAIWGFLHLIVTLIAIFYIQKPAHDIESDNHLEDIIPNFSMMHIMKRFIRIFTRSNDTKLNRMFHSKSTSALVYTPNNQEQIH